jgi:hypothetical protein
MVNHPLDDAEPTPAPAPLLTPNERLLRHLLPNTQVAAVLKLVGDELLAAVTMHGPMKSAHEGYAVLLEEVDELWDEVKKNDRTRCKRKMFAEAKQVAAMGLRFMLDVCGDLPVCVAGGRIILDRRVITRRVDHVRAALDCPKGNGNRRVAASDRRRPRP